MPLPKHPVVGFLTNLGKRAVMAAADELLDEAQDALRNVNARISTVRTNARAKKKPEREHDKNTIDAEFTPVDEDSSRRRASREH